MAAKKHAMVTLKDVASEAGVSLATASLAINGNSLVKPETRLRIMEVVQKLGYVPNEDARSLITRRTKVIGLLSVHDSDQNAGIRFKETPGNYFTDMLWSLEKGIAERGYHAVLEWYNVNDQTPPMLANANLVDGIICVGGLAHQRLLGMLKACGVPIVLVGSRSKTIDYVDVDLEEAAYLATKYIVSQGHRDILMLAGPRGSQSSPRKLEGFRKALEEARMDDTARSVFTHDFSGAAGMSRTKQVFDSGFRPTAIVAATDSLGVGALHYLHSVGLSCPEDVSIIGYENSTFAQYAIPSLTTMAINEGALGKDACDILFHRLENPGSRHVAVLHHATLLEQDSVCRREGA